MLVLESTRALEKLDCRLHDFDVGYPVLSLSIQKLIRLSDLSRSVASQQEGNVIAPVAYQLAECPPLVGSSWACEKDMFNRLVSPATSAARTLSRAFCEKGLVQPAVSGSRLYEYSCLV
jgi:hypothetical protein